MPRIRHFALGHGQNSMIFQQISTRSSPHRNSGETRPCKKGQGALALKQAESGRRLTHRTDVLPPAEVFVAASEITRSR